MSPILLQVRVISASETRHQQQEVFGKTVGCGGGARGNRFVVVDGHVQRAAKGWASVAENIRCADSDIVQFFGLSSLVLDKGDQ